MMLFPLFTYFYNETRRLLLYRILKILIGIGIRLYYREIKVKNRQYLDHDGPMIIIANHPNTLMDAWMIGQVCKQPIHYMAKGTFFNSKFKRWILGSLNMIPINRSVDEKIQGVSNADSFEACYRVLEAGKTLVIFPEGNSLLERQLRQLKTGTARIALEVEKRNQGNLHLKVVPLGLFYSKAEKFRSSVMISIGAGMFVTNYLKEFTEKSGDAARHLTAEFRKHLERVLVTTESSEQEKLLEEIYTIMCDAREVRSVEDRAELMQQIKMRIEEIQLIHPYKLEEIQDLVNSINWQTKKLRIKTDFLNKRFRSQPYWFQLMISILFVVLGLPLFLFGFIQSYLPFKTTDLLMPKLVTSVEYYAPIAVLLGLVLYPLNYFLMLSLASSLFDLQGYAKLLYFISMPVTGLFAFHFGHYLSKTAYKWKYIFLVINEKTAVRDLRNQEKKLEDLIF